METKRFSWLHLTDLHAGMSEESWLWHNVEEELLKDLERLREPVGPIDVIFFTGDLTNKGNDAEFGRFNEVLTIIKGKLKQLGSEPVFVAVPGNHDLVRPLEESAVVHSLRVWNDDEGLRRTFWSDQECDYRTAVQEAFQNWQEWAELTIDWEKLHEFNHDGVLPGDFIATWEKRGLRIGILGLNSAALQLAGGDYQGRLSLHASQASELAGKLYKWVDDHDACFLLTHHDPTWLDAAGKEAWQAEIAKPGRFVIHLCGHRHQQERTLVRAGGAEPRRINIGRSLFGLEWYEHRNERVERHHGYSAGWIDFGETREMRIWPRWAVKQQAGHLEIKPDQSDMLDVDEGTSSEDLGSSPRNQTQEQRRNDDTTPTNLLAGWTELTPDFLASKRIAFNNDQLRVFYDGQEPSWEHALASEEHVPRREVVSRALEVLRRNVSQTMVLLLGAGGEGKSTALRQIAVNLAADEYRVLFREPGAKLDPDSVSGLPEGGSWMLVSDDADEIAREVEKSVKRLCTTSRRDVHWVLGARDTDWEARFRRGRQSYEPSWETLVSLWPSRKDRALILGLSSQDATKIVRAWTVAGSLGALETVPETERPQALVQSARRQEGLSDGTFFGAILEQRFGAEGLRGHLETLLHRLGDAYHEIGRGYTLGDAFLYAAAAEAVGIDGVDLNVVADLLGVDRRDRRSVILHRLGQEAVATGGGGVLRTRHPSIARAAVLLIEDGRIDGDLEEIYKELVRGTGHTGRQLRLSVYGDIMNCGPRLLEELPKLGIDHDRAIRIACGTADEAERAEPDLLIPTVNRAKTYREAGKQDESEEVLLAELPSASSRSDWNKTGRGFLHELAINEGLQEHYAEDFLLEAMSLADLPGLGVVLRQQAIFSIGGIGGKCLELDERASLPSYGPSLLQASAVLYPLAVGDADDSWAKSYSIAAEKHGVEPCDVDEALLMLANAAGDAWRDVVQPDILAFLEQVHPEGRFGFANLKRRIRPDRRKR